jgi:Na+-driven multidrug efflux pump
LTLYCGKALTVSILCGIFITLVYGMFTQNMLSILNVTPSLRPDASAYIYLRGSITSAALAQSVCLSVLMSTGDALTPLKIVGIASLVNVFGDAALCVWPLRWGCAGAAAATAFATLVSCYFMLKALAKKNILPSIRIPKKHELKGLLEYTGPLFAITLTRLGGFVAMQRSAMILGHQSLAGYQLCINIMLFFLLFGEPLSQLSQTKLPGLLEAEDGTSIRATLESISILAVATSIAIASITYMAAMYGAGLFSTDAVVHQIAQKSASSLFVAVGISILAVGVDGANMASRDFMFMLVVGSATFLAQLLMLPHCKSVADILGTFSVRLGAYAIASLYRILSGSGKIGRTLKKKSLP